MKATPWITYRTRFLVKAKQLTTSLTFTDALGRLHSGRKGDYLVESSDGVLRIAPRQIFEDIYVPLLADQPANFSECFVSTNPPLSPRKKQADRHNELRPAAFNLPLPRKSPQPERAPAKLATGH